VASLVAQVAHRLRVAFDATSDFGFDALQPWVRQIKRHADQWRRIGASPLVAQVHRRLERQVLCRELLVELMDEPFDARAADRQPQLGDPPTK
jgi:hypothetical protein